MHVDSLRSALHRRDELVGDLSDVAAPAQSRRGYSSSTSVEIRLMADISASVGAHGWHEMNHTTHGPAVVSAAL